MAKPKNEIFVKDLVIQAGAGDQVVGTGIIDSKTGPIPDKGPNYFEVRLYIQDHGRENDTETGRDPEWIDFTEIENTYRLEEVTDVISIGGEGKRPYVFEASSLSLKLNNGDYIFDNLKRANLTTVKGNTAKFLSTPENSNLDLRNREVKLTGRFSQAERTVEQDLCHFIVRGIETSSDGSATLNLDSLEKQFMEVQAGKVKDGRNWYANRSVKFLVEELIKSVRRKYESTKEKIKDGDIINISTLETPDGDRQFSEFGKPIAKIKPLGNVDSNLAGEKTFITTAAIKRNIFRSILVAPISTGSNIIRIGIAGDKFTIKKGDILTIGKETAASFDALQSEKVTVLEDVTFTGIGHAPINIYDYDALEQKNIKVSTIQHPHSVREIVERWIIYLGVTRNVEEKTESEDEVYLLAFDPDRDEYASLINVNNSGYSTHDYLRYPVRFLGLKHDLNGNEVISNKYGLPTLTKLMAIGCQHTFPGKPNENGNILAWTINTAKAWDDPTHLTLAATETLSDEDDGGIYTGEINFRSLAPIVDNTYMNVDGGSGHESRIYGAYGFGQFVPESIFHSTNLTSRTINHNFNGERYMGFGHYAGLADAVEGTTSSPITDIDVRVPALNKVIMGIHGHTNITGTLWLIGCSHSSIDKQDAGGEEVIEENFTTDDGNNNGNHLITASARIEYAYRKTTDVDGKPNEGNCIVTYHLAEGIDRKFDIENTVVVIVPDTGKMYLRNCGENLIVREPHDLNFNAYSFNSGAVQAIDSNVYHDKIRMEKKLDLDEKKTDTAFEKELIDNSAVDKGYYNTIVQKRKMTVEAGDEINETTIYRSTTTSRKRVSNVVTIECTAHTLTIGDKITVLGLGGENYNGTWTVVSIINDNCFTYNNSGDNENKISDMGGVITLVNLITTIKGVGYSIRAVPAQYISMPFNIDDYEFGYPLYFKDNTVKGGTLDDAPNSSIYINVFKNRIEYLMANKGVISSIITKILESITYNKNMHCWIYPVIGLWVKYDNVNESIVSFDGTSVASHGNSELLGYWYLAYNDIDYTEEKEISTAQEDRYDEIVTNSSPIMDLAICDKNGLVVTPQVYNKFNKLFQDNHFPMCTILHNINDTPIIYASSETEFHRDEKLVMQGNINGLIRTRLKFIVGGDFSTESCEYNGEKLTFTQWVPQASQFTKSFPLKIQHPVKGNIYLQWKFKKLKNPQAKGSLFVASHCQPVRPYHYHYPLGSSFANFIDEKQILQQCNSLQFNLQYIRNTNPDTSAIETNAMWIGVEHNKLISDGAVEQWYVLIRAIDSYATTNEYPIIDFTGNISGSFTGYIGSFKAIAYHFGFLYGIGAVFWIKLENFFLDSVSSTTSMTDAYLQVKQENVYSGYNIDTNFSSGSEENKNFIDSAESNQDQHMAWVADRFTQSKLSGMVYGYGNARASGGFLEGVSITDINNVERRLKIPLGHYYGDSNIIDLTLNNVFSPISILPNLNIYGSSYSGIIVIPRKREEGDILFFHVPLPPVWVYDGNIVGTRIFYNHGDDRKILHKDDFINITINGVDKGKWKVIEHSRLDANNAVALVSNIDTSWESTTATFTPYTNMCAGDIYKARRAVSLGGGYDDTGYLKILEVINNTRVIFKWVSLKTYEEIAATASIEPISTKKTLHHCEAGYRTYASLDDSNINVDGKMEAPGYELEIVKHLDVIKGAPSDIAKDRQILSFLRMNFNVRPTLDGNINYPKALYSRNLHKFWYYEKRLSSYGNGTGDYSSALTEGGLLPTTFDAGFFDGVGKYYLSRRDHTINVMGTDTNYIFCDSYTPNFNSSSIGNDDDNLYAIVHANYQSTLLERKHLFARFCLGFQKNFKLDPFNDNIIYFARRKFKQNPYGELYIDSRITEYNYNSGSPTLTDHVSFPNALFGSNTIDEGEAVENLSTGDIDEGEAVENLSTGDIEENPEVDELSTYSLGDFEVHGIFKSYEGILFNCGIVNWKNIDYTDNNGFVELTDKTDALPFSKPYYKNLSCEKLGYGVGGSWRLLPWEDTYETKYSKDSVFVLDADNFGYKGYMYLFTGWVDESESCTTLSPGYSYKSHRGIIFRKNDILNEGQEIRERRDYLGIFAIEPVTHVDPDNDYLHFGIATKWSGSPLTEHIYTSAYPLTSIRKFTFNRLTVTTENGYFFANTKDNTIHNWNGEIYTNYGDPILLGDNQSCVEGDFGQYEPMIKLETAYEEIFGFSVGTRLHISTASIKGGRNIIWKLSEHLAHHIAIADFENLSVWDALSQFAEQTDSILSFDRFGYLHFEGRPNTKDLDTDSPYVFTFDKMSLGNIDSITKKDALTQLYNYIEIIPSKPILPSATVDLTTQSDITALTLNYDTFIKDYKLDIVQGDKNQGRSVVTIQAYQKDFERKKILLICNNGQYNTPELQESGTNSRWKYMMVEDNIELRTTKEISVGNRDIYVNNIPYNTVADKLSVEVGHQLYIGNVGPYAITAIDTVNNKITVNSSLARFDAGFPIRIISTFEDIDAFHATGEGNFQDSYTYSPKTFFTEIGEWTFDESKVRKTLKLTEALSRSSETLKVDDTTYLDARGGILSINGELIAYSTFKGKTVYIRSGLESDHALGSKVYIMPLTPIWGGATNANYIPGNWRIGGYDEIGPTCDNEMHLYDPNGDGVPYYDADPDLGGSPITALEFYWEGQNDISYADSTGSGLTISNGIRGTESDLKNRHRTFIELRVQDFAGYRFKDGDKIDIDLPGMKLEPQEHLKKIYSDLESIKRHGLKQYPETNNRFFDNKRALLFGRRIIESMAGLGCEVVITANINDINLIDYVKYIRIIDKDMFDGMENNQVIAYVSNISYNIKRKQAVITAFTQPI